MNRLIEHPWGKAGITAAILIAVSIPAAWLMRSPSPPYLPTRDATFVGGNSCINCHQSEYQSWKGSNHDNAMDVAADSTVLGDFNNAEFPFEGKRHKFYRREGKFFVFTEGTDGAMKEFQVSHTFGVRPLQQYLVPFENGKLQCLPIAWDTIRKRWFHMAAMVYDKKSRSPGNWLYWTNQAQNWNGMCAECHSTNLQKNFDPATRSFSTTWTDIDVNCEACHGPGSRHVEWASNPDRGSAKEPARYLAVRTRDIPSKRLVEICAPCHSRRSSLGPFDYGHPELMSNAVPQLISPPNYFIDGQIREEDYEYGSFAQSKMYMNGVRCTDCHNPHTLKLKREGNALCTQCHIAENYDTPVHHFHKEPGSQAAKNFGGTLCVNCHMTGRYYMGIHFRRDHSFRRPRPDLTITAGTPNACNNCHKGRDANWAARLINKWYGAERKPHYSARFAEANAKPENSGSILTSLVGNDSLPPIVRATALEYLSGSGDTAAVAAFRINLHDADPIIRYTAVRHFVTNDSAQFLSGLTPMLSDSARAVRIEAANKLKGFGREQFNDAGYVAYRSALLEYEAAMNYASDFPTGRFNLGKYYEETGDSRRSEENYREAIAIDGLFYPAKVNLAFLYYKEDQPARAESLFIDVSKNHPDYPDADYNLGLLYAEQGRDKDAVKRLELAAAKHGSVKVYYNLALAYQRVKEFGKSESYLLKSLALEPGEYRTLYALCEFYVKTGSYPKAETYAGELLSRYPGDADAQKLSAFIKEKNRP